MLTEEVPVEHRQLRAKVIMKENPLTLSCVPKVKDIQRALIAGYSTIPVVNESGFLIGNIPKNFLIVLMKNRAFFKKDINHGKK